MPSSLIFTGLVVLWLLILVPAVARHQQEVARPSGASLSGRVLARPGRRVEGDRTEEGDSMDEDDAATVGTCADGPARMPPAPGGGSVRVPAQSRWADDEPDDAEITDGEPADDEDDEFGAVDDRLWERPPPRYRPGRGGYDPDADAESARTRYAFRQRVVLALLVCALLTGVAAAAALPALWWAHAAADLALVTYLVYLRRQVRLEAAIRERRAARMAGTRRTSAADDRDLDEWARRGREVTRRPLHLEPTGSDPDDERVEADLPVAPAATRTVAPPVVDPVVDEAGDGWAEDGDTTRVRGVGEPIGLLPARRRGAEGDDAEPESALPPLRPVPPPPLPPGTSLVVVDDDDLDLHDLGGPVHPPHRRAVGE